MTAGKGQAIAGTGRYLLHAQRLLQSRIFQPSLMHNLQPASSLLSHRSVQLFWISLAEPFDKYMPEQHIIKAKRKKLSLIREQ
jgi:hypothetical protein